ncbi:hypothetical protein ACOALA_20590 (plasmid) [Alicyclobacillus acidoterrestris]|uniref:hypothetical protein n=1 Tax=Alicyclobacillus acidoterrestris TaxID=1450 RepID=UPI003F538E4E
MRFLFRTTFRLARLILLPMMIVVSVANTHDWLSPTVAVLGLAWCYTLLRMIGDFQKLIRGW